MAISLKFVLLGPINNIVASIQIMDWQQANKRLAIMRTSYVNAFLCIYASFGPNIDILKCFSSW